MTQTISARVCDDISYLLKLRNMNIQELEEAIGISKGYISRCANGKKLLSIDIVVNIANYFGVTVDDLINCKHKSDYIKKLIEENKEQIINYERQLKNIEEVNADGRVSN